MRHRSLIPINVRFLGASMRRLSCQFAAEGAAGGDGGAGAAGGEGGAGAGGAGAGAGGEGGAGTAPKTYTEADLAALKANNAALKKEKDALKARAAIIGDRTPEDIQADLEYAAKAREDKAKAEGDFQTLKQQLVDQHAKEREKLTGRTAKFEGKLYDVMAKREAEAAITAAGGNAKVLLPHVLPFIKVAEHDDDFEVTVVDTKGNVRIADSRGTPMTIAQLVDTFKTDDIFGVAFSASGASGSGARNDGASSAGRDTATVIIPRNATPQEYRRLKEDATKRGVSYAVAQG